MRRLKRDASVGLPAAVLLLLSAQGCGIEETFRAQPAASTIPQIKPASKDSPKALPGQLGAKVAVPAGVVTVGLSGYATTRQVTLGGFEISKLPISVKEFGLCVAAGSCSAAKNRCGDEPVEEGSDLPAVCVGTENAAAYCEWANGNLPSFTEWVAAARGPEVRHYSWGDEGPTAARHAGWRDAPNAAPVAAVPPPVVRGVVLSVAAEPSRSLKLGNHPEGASPAGVQDVLVTPSELVGMSSDSLFTVCEGSGAACLVTSSGAGQISGVSPAGGPANGVPASQYAFRCVWRSK